MNIIPYFLIKRNRSPARLAAIETVEAGTQAASPGRTAGACCLCVLFAKGMERELKGEWKFGLFFMPVPMIKIQDKCDEIMTVL